MLLSIPVFWGGLPILRRTCQLITRVISLLRESITTSALKISSMEFTFIREIQARQEPWLETLTRPLGYVRTSKPITRSRFRTRDSSRQISLTRRAEASIHKAYSEEPRERSANF